MTHFTCGDVLDGCPVRFSAATPLDVLRQVTEHAWLDHGLHLPHLPADLTRAVLAAVRPTSSPERATATTG